MCYKNICLVVLRRQDKNDQAAREEIKEKSGNCIREEVTKK